MTLDEYSKNPLGQKNALFSQRDMYKELYTNKLDKILLRENGKISYKLYTSKDNYYIYMKIPSEVINNFYYDVIIELYTKNPLIKNSRTLDKYDFRCYSNSPDYVFTFAHAMIKNDMFISDLKPKMSELAIKNIAKEKNPKNQIGYIKGLYFAYILIKRYNLLHKIEFEANAEKYNKNVLLDLIMHADEKIKLRQELGKDIEKEKRIKEVKEKNDKTNVRTEVKSSNNIKRTSFIKRTSNIKNTTRTRITKSSKRK